MDIIESVIWEEPILCVYGGDNENTPRLGGGPTNSRSLGEISSTSPPQPGI
ncbi:hypothetical protein DPMN_033524 [Dreissena polymorpha]|uniref:Uncharacterized protein n=1 Tax=Dreissena polymorpha TaxID=45954 RepID=A0A9D4M763_DREPO|nr:hypothetical protein DPMN_033524 [Dreissena polymorpha]